MGPGLRPPRVVVPACVPPTKSVLAAIEALVARASPVPPMARADRERSVPSATRQTKPSLGPPTVVMRSVVPKSVGTVTKPTANASPLAGSTAIARAESSPWAAPLAAAMCASITAPLAGVELEDGGAERGVSRGRERARRVDLKRSAGAPRDEQVAAGEREPVRLVRVHAAESVDPAKPSHRVEREDQAIVPALAHGRVARPAREEDGHRARGRAHVEVASGVVERACDPVVAVTLDGGDTGAATVRSVELDARTFVTDNASRRRAIRPANSTMASAVSHAVCLAES